MQNTNRASISLSYQKKNLLRRPPFLKLNFMQNLIIEQQQLANNFKNAREKKNAN